MCNSNKDLRREDIKMGSKVTPITPGGLCLSVEAVDGRYQQNLTTSCVFRGIGTILRLCPMIIDYDTWDDYPGIGKLEYVNCLVECEDGVGWAGKGALTLVK